jgi:nitrogen regulatory protein P-II 1
MFRVDLASQFAPKNGRRVFAPSQRHPVCSCAAGRMKRVEAIIEPSDLEVLKDRLVSIGFERMTISQVKRLGAETVRTEVYRGVAYEADFAPRICVQLFVADRAVDKLVDAIVMLSRAGKVGDASVFIEPIEEVVRIETGERGEDAL